MLGDRIHDVFLRRVAELDDRVLQFGAGLGLEGFRLRNLIGTENTLLDENIGEIAAGLAHEKMPPVNACHNSAELGIRAGRTNRVEKCATSCRPLTWHHLL